MGCALDARRVSRGALLGVACALAIAACSSSSSHASNPTSSPSPGANASTSSSPSRSQQSVRSNTVWLCRPGLPKNPCESSEATTVVSATGRTSRVSAAPAVDPKVDCFYVYPTVSDQKTAVANLHVDPEERAIALNQASRFSQVCRVFAPMYRQATLSAIQTATSPGAKSNAVKIDVGYQDVVAAWDDYLAHDNDGRGVVLIGHSQGSGVLIRLMRSRIDTDPNERRLLVSAVILGGNVTVKAGSDAGGDFTNIPACRSRTQTGCVVAYSSFAQAPPANSLFGRPGTGPRAGQPNAAALQVLCVNPAAPSGGTATLTLYFTTTKFPGLIGTVSGPTPSAPTPWVSYPGRYTARCETANGASWLQVTPLNTPGDTRPVVTQTLGPTWGLHLYDVNIALGDLVDLVKTQAQAFHAPNG
jgi:Protein of unknown function (DUF3089)